MEPSFLWEVTAHGHLCMGYRLQCIGTSGAGLCPGTGGSLCGQLSYGGDLSGKPVILPQQLDVSDCDLLIIDDLGTEMVNQFTLSCLYDVLNSRINNRRSTMINTNLPTKEIEAKYNERITSRLFGEYLPLLFSGVDIRRQKIQKR